MSLDKIIKDFDLNDPKRGTMTERIVSIRLPENYKMKYDMIQARSQKQFSVQVRKLVMAAIDRVDLESKAG